MRPVHGASRLSKARFWMPEKKKAKNRVGGRCRAWRWARHYSPNSSTKPERPGLYLPWPASTTHHGKNHWEGTKNTIEAPICRIEKEMSCVTMNGIKITKEPNRSSCREEKPNTHKPSSCLSSNCSVFINRSVCSGLVPVHFKNAVVHHWWKHFLDPAVFVRFRLISRLSFFSLCHLYFQN